MATWRGKGEEEAAVEAVRLQAEDGGIGFTVFGCDKRIPITHRYKHVGSISRADLKACSDVTAKMGAIRGSAAKLKKHVLANEDIAIGTRVGVLHTHVAADAWMQSINEERPPTPPRGRPHVAGSSLEYF